jgi:hypothetical protein
MKYKRDGRQRTPFYVLIYMKTLKNEDESLETLMHVIFIPLCSQVFLNRCFGGSLKRLFHDGGAQLPMV